MMSTKFPDLLNPPVTVILKQLISNSHASPRLRSWQSRLLFCRSVVIVMCVCLVRSACLFEIGVDSLGKHKCKRPIWRKHNPPAPSHCGCQVLMVPYPLFPSFVPIFYRRINRNSALPLSRVEEGVEFGGHFAAQCLAAVR